MKRITVTINRKSGALSVATSGYAGAECLEGAAAQLEKELGMKTEGACTLTPEYFANKEENKDQVGGA
jgi:hypothetical protein